MNTRTADVFGTTLEKSAAWVDEIGAELDSHDPHFAYSALRATLHALRDRLIVEEAVDLGAQLPMLIRGLYYEGWTLSGKPVKRHRAEFLEAIRDRFGAATQPDAERLARAVFAVLRRHVTAGEIEQVEGMLPKDLRDLWERRLDD